jgi:hypothetical protein
MNQKSLKTKYTMKDIHECISDIGRAESTIFTKLDLTTMNRLQLAIIDFDFDFQERVGDARGFSVKKLYQNWRFLSSGC